MARILVIDDNADLRNALETGLSRASHAVTLAADGNEALRMMANQDFDIAIVDIIMPDKDGIETIIELKQLKPNLGIIAMSGGGQARYFGFLDMAGKFGAQEILKKPFRIKDLLAAVERCLAPGVTSAPTGERERGS